MAISETQKVDYLWKKLAYGLSKTDTNANKRATNESISSPLLLRGNNVWSQADLIPGVMPGSSSGVVTVYPTSAPDETTADVTATASRTWKTGLTDWIPPEIGSTYLVKVYIHTSGDAANAAGSGTQVFGAGSGNDDEWFFDYQAGTLHFVGTNLPNGVNFSGKSVYVSGARYTGIKGVSVPGSTASFTDVTLTDTDAGSSAGPELKLYRNSASPADADYLGQIKFAGESDTGVERNYAKITGKISDATNGTEDGILEFAFIKDGSQNINARFKSTELQLLNDTDFSVAGNSTFNDNVRIVSLTDNRIPIVGVGNTIEDDANLTFDGLQLTVGVDLDVTGNAGIGSLDVVGVSTFGGIATFTDTTDNTLGNTGTGAVKIAGGLAVAKNVTVGSGLSVTGTSYFVGEVTFAGGTSGNDINLGSTNEDNVVFVADVKSHIIPDADDTYDLGSSSNQWKDLYVNGLADLDFVNVSAAATFAGITTVTGDTLFTKQLNVSGVSTFAGITTVTGSTLFTKQLNVSGVSTFANNIDANGVNVSGATTTNILHVGTAGTVLSVNDETSEFKIGSATNPVTATMNGGAIPSIGLVIALGG